MGGFFTWLTGIGTPEELEANFSEPGIVLNRVGFLSFAITFCYAIALFFFGFHVVGRSQVPFVALYSLVPLLTHFQKFQLAKTLLMVSILCQVILLALLFWQT